MRHAAIILGVLALSACASEEKFQQAAASWIGRSEDALVSQFGPPDRSHTTSDGSRIIEWRRQNESYIPGTPPTYQTYCTGRICNSYPVGGSPGFAYTNWCNLSFTVHEGVVRNYRYEGNSCAL